MLLKGNAVLENIDENNLSRELEVAKFRNYGREKFSELIPYKMTYKEFILNSSRFFSIKLPEEISEYFIRIDFAPYFMMSEAPILNDVQELLLLKGAEYNFITNYREVKNYYHKWLMQKTPKEKYFFANKITNSVERNFALQNFYNISLYGVILTYDPTFYNPKKAIEIFERAIEVINDCKISDRIKNNYKYILYLYKGFAHLKEYEYSKSLETFKTALEYSLSGVTANFYAGLSARYIDNFDLSYDYIKETIEYDKLRFKYAINCNQLQLFNFFYENAIFYNVFTENGFAQLLPDLDFLIRSLYSNETNSMDVTYSKLINLDNLRIKEFYNEVVVKEIEFLKDALNHYKMKKSGLIRIVEQIFRNKLVILIEYIRSTIEAYFYDQIQEDVVIFDKQIERSRNQLNKIKQEMEDTNKKIKNSLDESIEYLDESLTNKAKFIELKIDGLDKDPKYNPSQIFYSSMIFTVLVSFIIIFVVGSITFFVEIGGNTQLALKTALKWGGLTFAVGVFISLFTTISSSWEKNSEKKLLANQLKKVEKAKSEERELLYEDTTRKTEVFKKKFEKKIETQETIINTFIEERESNYQFKYTMAKKEVDKYILPLNELLKSLNEIG